MPCRCSMLPKSLSVKSEAVELEGNRTLDLVESFLYQRFDGD